eukprot:Seg1780.2 transcript_id=Seg1780.2/GoldUCD/mRNA.D3Y31 product="Muscarinic acetylcholine receptor M5" protein_id=Seg1780.2/GoldUCD/D3Y31
MNGTSIHPTCHFPWIINLALPDQRKHIIPLIVITVLLSLLSTFLNSMELVIFWRLQTIPGTTKSILLNLCAVDFILGTVQEPIYITFLLLQLAGKMNCDLALVKTLLSTFLLIISFSILLLASLERYILIIHPFVYVRIKDTWLFKTLIALAWMIAIILTSILAILTNQKQGKIILNVIGAYACAGLFVIAVLYIHIYYKAYKIHREIKDQANSIQAAEPKRNQSAHMIGIVVATSLLCYAPFLSSLIFDKIGPVEISWFYVIMLMNPCLDSVCYCVLNKTLRDAMIRILRGVKCFIFKSNNQY